MTRWLKISAPILLLAVGGFFWMAHRAAQSIREDLQQTQAALQSVNSFHFHFQGANFLAGEPPMNQEVWVVCPDFRYEINRVEGAPEREEIHYHGDAYAKVGDRWVKLPGSQPSAVQGCGTLTGEYGLGVPAGFGLMLSSGVIQVDNHPRNLGGDPCYDYTVTITTADVARRKLVQKLCLNSDDHLPREASFQVRADEGAVRTYTYDQWNRIAQPPFPDGFSPVNY